MSEDKELPFLPFDATLKDILKDNQMKDVALWLLGKEATSILAQKSNSLWESSLSILYLINIVPIYAAGDANEVRLCNEIKSKSKLVARWLVEQKTQSADGKFIHWEGVTWDTSVALRAIAKVFKEYESEFSETERKEIITCISKGVAWLYFRFSKWEKEVKYPFGPADVAQIISTLILVSSDFPELYKTFLSATGKKACEIEVEIVRYLLHIKTEKTLTIPITSEKDEEVVTYWWDDFFSTAEVVEALAVFYNYYCRADTELNKVDAKILSSTKQALVRACLYFEQSQVDGMWGSHIDTIKVIYAYVRIRNLIPQSGQDKKQQPLITPEIHTTFKALRWMCDEKQIFSDGSFLHTMFLTVFYSHALLEVYKNWEPANLPLIQLYDDVIWFSPVRTTPERSKRLAAELQIDVLQKTMDEKDVDLIKYRRFIRTSITSFVSVVFFILIGLIFHVFSVTFGISFGTDKNLSIAYLTLSIPTLLAIIGSIWYWDRIFNK